MEENASTAATIDPKWSDDAFLNRLRASTDDEANGAFEQLQIAKVSREDTARLFRALTAYDSALPDDTPGPIRAFLGATRAHRDAMLPEVDYERIQRSNRFFRVHAAQACVVMLASSLPSGYSAPCLAKVLAISDELQRHPYRRLMGVLQMLVNIAQVHDDPNESQNLVTTQKLRLLHAGVRSAVHKVTPEYEEVYGSPVNHEDMLGTIMGFSYLVIEGFKNLEVDLQEGEVEDYWYAWSQFARLMGIYPSGQPLSEEFIPQSYAEAEAFYASYKRRHFETDPAKNPEGVKLAHRNLEMMRDLLPKWLRWSTGMVAPRLAMSHTLGEEGMARVGISTVTGHDHMNSVMERLMRFSLKTHHHLPNFFSVLSSLIMQTMISVARGGKVNFSIPMTARDLHPERSESSEKPTRHRPSLREIFSHHRGD